MQTHYLTILLAFSYAFLQGSNIDSLKQVCQQQPELDEKIACLLHICNYYDIYKSFNQDSLSKYGQEVLELSRQSSNQLLHLKAQFCFLASSAAKDSTHAFQKLQELAEQFLKQGAHFEAGETWFRLSNWYSRFSRFDLSNTYAFKAIDLIGAVDHQKEAELLIRCYNVLFSNFQSLGFVLEALEYGLKLEELSKKYGSIENKLRALKVMGSLYGNLSLDNRNFGSVEDKKRYRKLARTYIHQTYELAKAHENHRMSIVAGYNLGLIYSEEANWESSDHYLKETIREAKRIDYKEALINALEIKAFNFLAQGEPDSAGGLYHKAYEIAYQTNSPDIKMSASYDLGQYYFDCGNNELALQYTQEGLRLAIVQGRIFKMKVGYNNLYEIYKKTGKNDLALVNHEKFIALKDSLSSVEIRKQVEATRTLYETAEKEKRIAELNVEKVDQKLDFQRKLGWSIITILLLLLLGTIYFFISRHKAIQTRNESMELEQRLLRSQMNPHFTFNALSSIQSHLLGGNAQLGAHYLATLAKLMRQILYQSQSAMIPLQEEIETITNYLELQKMRYEGEFDYQIQLEAGIAADELLIPPMLLQPILENAIEHGKIYRRVNGKVSISIERKKQVLHIEILDNGVGRQNVNPEKISSQNESYALKIIEQRLRPLREMYGRAINFSIFDPQEGGTKVVFNLPLVENF